MQKEGLVKFLTQLSKEDAQPFYPERLVVLITNTEDVSVKTPEWIEDKDIRYGSAAGESVERILELVSDNLGRMNRTLTSQEIMDEEELNGSLSMEVSDSLKYENTPFERVAVFSNVEDLAGDVASHDEFEEAYVVFVSWYTEDYHQKGYCAYHLKSTMKQYLTTKHG